MLYLSFIFLLTDCVHVMSTGAILFAAISQRSSTVDLLFTVYNYINMFHKQLENSTTAWAYCCSCKLFDFRL